MVKHVRTLLLSQAQQVQTLLPVLDLIATPRPHRSCMRFFRLLRYASLVSVPAPEFGRLLGVTRSVLRSRIGAHGAAGEMM